MPTSDEIARLLYDPTPDTPYTDLDHILALGSNTVRNMVPGGNRLSANMQAMAAGTDDAEARLRQINAADDALFNDYPLQTIGANVASVALPVGAVGRATNAMMTTLPRMMAAGTGLAITDESLDRPDDANIGRAALTGALGGVAARAAGPALQSVQRFLPRSPATPALPRGPDMTSTYRPPPVGPLPDMRRPPPIQASRLTPEERAAYIRQVQKQTRGGGGAASSPAGSPGRPDLPQSGQAGQPASAGPAPLPGQGQGFPPPGGSSQVPQPSKPLPTSRVPYTQEHTELVQPVFEGILQKQPGQFNKMNAATRTKFVDELREGIRDAGLPVPSAQNIDRRLGRTFKILREQQQAGKDLRDPNVIGTAFGKAGTLGLGGAVASPEIVDLLMRQPDRPTSQDSAVMQALVASGR